MLQSFLLVLLGVAAAQASPGPNMFAVIETALGRGRRSALLVVAGIASGTLVWAALASLGLGAVFAAVPALLTALKFIGGAYLCYLGFRALRAVLRGGHLGVELVQAPQQISCVVHRSSFRSAAQRLSRSVLSRRVNATPSART